MMSGSKRHSLGSHILPVTPINNLPKDSSAKAKNTNSTSENKIKNSNNTSGKKSNNKQVAKTDGACQTEDLGDDKLDSLDDMTLKELLKVSIRKSEKVMSSIAGMETKLDTAISDLKKENKELSNRFDNLKVTVSEQANSIEFNSNAVSDLKNTVQLNKETLSQDIKTVAENNRNVVHTTKKLTEDVKSINARMTTHECQMEQIQGHSLNPRDVEFPIERTIVLQHVLYEEDEDIEKVSHGIVNGCLELPNVVVTKAKRISVRDDGTGLVKVKLASEDMLREVLKNKTRIKNNDNEDIALIWIRQSKSKEQLLIEQNSDAILRECQLEGNLIRLTNGRLVKKTFYGSNRGGRGYSRGRGGVRGRGRGAINRSINRSSTFTNSNLKKRGYSDIVSPDKVVGVNEGIKRARRYSNKAGPAVGEVNALDEKVAQGMERKKRHSSSREQIDETIPE